MTKASEHGQPRRPGMLRIAGWSLAALLLLLPLVAMQFTEEVKWTASDFVFAGVLIGGVGGALEMAVRMTPNLAYRGGVALVLAATFLLIWINAAVGIIGGEDNPMNLLYVGVLAVALAGAIGAGFRPRGMARAMLTPACLMTLIGAVGAFIGGDEPPGALGFFILNGFFAGLFASSAWLFRTAARDPAS